MSICPHCEEITKFRPTTAKNQIWFECLGCGGKVTSIPNRKNQIPKDAVIVPFDFQDDYIDDPDEDYFEPDEEEQDLGDDLETQLAQALQIAEQEKLAEKREEEKKVKKPLLEKKREIMRELDSDPEEEYDEEYEEDYEPPTRRKYKISTQILREVLADYKCNKKFIEDITKKAESVTEPLSTEKLRYYFDRWDAGKKTGKQVQQIIDAYLDELSDFEVDENTPQRRDYPLYKQRMIGKEEPQVLTIQDFLAMEREKSIREKEEQQRQLEIEQLDDAKAEVEEYKELYRESVDELKELEKEYQKLINENLELKMNLKVAELQMQNQAKYSSDDMKLTADILDKATDLVKESKPLQQLTGMLGNRRMPSDSRIQPSPNQDERTREFEALTKGKASETSKVLLEQQLNIEDMMVDEDEEYEE